MFIQKSATRTVPRRSIKMLDFTAFGLPLPVHLAVKEVWRNKGRFLLIAMVIALITTLVLFVDGLAAGLGNGNKAYIEKINADLLLFQEKTDLSISASRIGRDELRRVRRVEGVKSIGAISFSSAAIYRGENEDLFKVSMIGVEPGLPGEPPALEGRGLVNKQDKEVIIDGNVAVRAGLGVGDKIIIKATQGTREEFFPLTIVGVTDDRQYQIQPSIFVPYITWDRIRPKGDTTSPELGVVANIVAVQLDNSNDISLMADRLESDLGNVEAVDLVTAYEASPGYTAQQSTLNTQRMFAILIGALVIGGFFQIQTLQKVAQIGMLKAIGAPTPVIAVAFILQIILVTIMGVAIGGLGTLALSLALPPVVPISFTPTTVVAAVGSLLLVGPIAGLVSLRVLLKVEPLTALGLSS